MGGLGNQMFQYAFAKHISIEKGVELKIDTSLLGEGDVENLVIRHFDLDVFNIQKIEDIASIKEVEKFNGKSSPTIIDRIVFKLKSFFSNDKLLLQKNNGITEDLINPEGSNLCIVGRWQSELFFIKNADLIKGIFNFNDFKPNSYSLSISKNMKASTSVSIQVRRGDYVTHPIYSKKLGALSIDYYKKSMALMKRKLLNTEIVFYVISDDIEWCKANFESLDENIVYVEQEKSKNGYLSDLWLLHLCDHAIISNSTFSWWGAWLGESEKSVVIAPGKWAISNDFSPEGIIPDRWFTIDNKFL